MHIIMINLNYHHSTRSNAQFASCMSFFIQKKLGSQSVGLGSSAIRSSYSKDY